MINAKTRLLIARHGNTFAPGDVVRRVGTTDLPLVESGCAQGRKLGAYLKQHHLLPDAIFASQLQRTMQTAEQAQAVMQTSLPIQSLSIFNEIDYGQDENMPEDAVIARVGKDALKEWEACARVPHGWNVDPQQIIRNWQEFSANLLKKYSGKTVLVVTSNGIARFAPSLTGDFDAFAAAHGIKIATGALCVFENTPPASDWSCLHWNVRPEQ